MRAPTAVRDRAPASLHPLDQVAIDDRDVFDEDMPDGEDAQVVDAHLQVDGVRCAVESGGGCVRVTVMGLVLTNCELR